jgi:hypothetical protein
MESSIHLTQFDAVASISPDAAQRAGGAATLNNVGQKPKTKRNQKLRSNR